MDRFHQKFVVKFVNLLQHVIIFSFRMEEWNNKRTIEEEATGRSLSRLLSRVRWVSSHNKPVNMPPCFVTLFSSRPEPEGGASSPTARRSWLLVFLGWGGGSIQNRSPSGWPRMFGCLVYLFKLGAKEFILKTALTSVWHYFEVQW